MATLGELYRRGEKLFAAVETNSRETRDPEHQATVRECLDTFAECGRMVRHAGVFSFNEEAEEISTGDLKFLLVPYYLATCELEVVDPDQREMRIERLRRSKMLADTFLFKLRGLGLLHESDVQTLEREEEPDANTLRSEKIARMKREKEVRQKLAEIKRRREQAAKPGEDPDEVEGIVDEEIERENTLLLLDSAARKCLDTLRMTQMEIEMLEKMGFPDPRQERPPPQPQGGDDSKPIKVVKITGDRDRLQAQVFRPGYSMPTMSIDEYLEIERQRGVIPEQGASTGGGNAGAPGSDNEDDEDEEAIDRATYKARSWDDWKDDNPRGAGNMRGRG